ncbi:AfsR/SARP family transcriptional regulator [Nocardia huaxiensis]|uniref:Winged helix-turn-helix domain-containing protein n=1 Tax=Nocardia huaxiensis TaxID=2755382 RepID=A0A7D6YYP1_9NOCA|nr:AfsR/SARP family transcriptional regulator [Nocardia huaxiensis]QLY27566.1 winged helix-turn-helix domain-containing protein [Nocardia huaxiensis]UFS99056.1 winged helix-turn-helix domain-containing protein [Nocardia huaxiensis]
MRFSVLGEVRAWRGDTPLDLGPPQRRAVLAALLLREGKAVTAAELVEGIWGEDPVLRAIPALRTHVAKLRRELEPERTMRGPSALLVSIGDGYALRVPPGCTDIDTVADHVAEAARLRLDDPVKARDTLVTALGHWQGAALGGLPGPYAERQRARIEQWRLAILEDRLALDIETGRTTEAVTELGPLIQEHPLRERFRALLMTALYHCGRQADALEEYARARRALVDGIGVEPGPELAAVHTRILRGDLPPVQRPVRPIQTPAQLPPDIADFTGRSQLAEEIAAQLTEDGSTVAISAVGGMGGIGKTTLALHVAHRVRERFPDGQLYVNLRGVDAEPVPPGDALGGFLRGLGVAEGDIPPTVADRAAQLRTLVSGKRILIVLDNARDSAHIAALLPGTPGTAVLITSRSSLTELPAVRRTRLDVLETAEALTLLTRILGAERVAAERDSALAIIEQCACLPLAVRIVGARLAVRPQWTIASLAARLADESQRLDVLQTGELTVDAAFQLGYGHLNPEQARAFRALARADVPDFPADAAAAVLDTTIAHAEYLCESLVDLSLLETTAAGRYRFHDLLRLFARRLPGEPESEVLVRVLDYYLASTKNLLSAIDYSNTTRLLVPTRVPGHLFSGGADGQCWNDIERPVVIALHRQAARLGGQALAVAADLAWVMGELTDAGTRARELAEALKALLHTAIREGDAASERRLRVALGAILQVGLGEVEASLEYLRSVSAPTDDADRRLQVLAEILLGVADRRLGNTKDSHRHFVNATALTRELGDRSMEAWILALATRTLCESGQYAEAEAVAGRAIELAREASNPIALGWATHELAATRSMLGDHPHARELGEEAVRITQRNGVRLWEGWARTRLAQIHLRADRTCEAEAEATQALHLLAKAADPVDRARAIVLRATARAARGDTVSAEREFRESAEIFRRAGLPPPTLATLFSPTPENR